MTYDKDIVIIINIFKRSRAQRTLRMNIQLIFYKNIHTFRTVYNVFNKIKELEGLVDSGNIIPSDGTRVLKIELFNCNI